MDFAKADLKKIGLFKLAGRSDGYAMP